MAYQIHLPVNLQDAPSKSNGEARAGHSFDLDVGEPLPKREGLPQPTTLKGVTL